jgi:hypothetical protein
MERGEIVWMLAAGLALFCVAGIGLGFFIHMGWNLYHPGP